MRKRELLAGIVARFEVTFSLNRKELQLKSTEEQVWAAVDKEAITKILSNLLNNALKYASQNVLVELEKGDRAPPAAAAILQTVACIPAPFHHSVGFASLAYPL